MLTSTEQAWLRLHMTDRLGRAALIRLQQMYETPQEALQAPPGQWSKNGGLKPRLQEELVAETDPLYQKAQSELATMQVRIVSFRDDEYPPLLKEIHDPPALLYVRGQLPSENSFAIVGSRRASAQATEVAKRLAAHLAQQGIGIISGLARGIDTAAHTGALNQPGSTFAVLGCGIDQIYPPENRKLFTEIAELGGIISEYAPGTAPLAGHFPGRNRIISGLSRGVLIVEAAEKSGSLITADFALEQGREVFALPGAVVRQNQGSNRLLKEGAHIVTEPADILHVLWPGQQTPKEQKTEYQLLEQMGEEERKVYQLLDEIGVHADELQQKSGLTPQNLSATLLHLELRGCISRLPGQLYRRHH